MRLDGFTISFRNGNSRVYLSPDAFAWYLKLEIDKNGQWRHKHRDIVLVQGEWYRKRNILVLKCPKLKCNFYAVIGENKLISMLTLGDFWGQIFYTETESHKVSSK